MPPTSADCSRIPAVSLVRSFPSSRAALALRWLGIVARQVTLLWLVSWVGHEVVAFLHLPFGDLLAQDGTAILATLIGSAAIGFVITGRLTQWLGRLRSHAVTTTNVRRPHVAIRTDRRWLHLAAVLMHSDQAASTARHHAATVFRLHFPLTPIHRDTRR